MILCLYVELEHPATAEDLLDAFRLMPGLVKGAYDATAVDVLLHHFSTLEEIECHMEGK